VLVLSCLVVGIVVTGPTAGVSAASSASPGAAPLVRLAGPVPVLPAGAAVTGPSDASAAVSAQVGLKPRDTAAPDAFIASVSTPGSPQYHHYLAPGRFATTFGPTPATIAATRAWLASSGLHVGATSPDGLLIPVSGSTAAMEQALDVSLVSTRLSDGRLARFAPQRPAVPTALAPMLTGVVGLSTVAAPQPQLVATRPGGSTTSGGTSHAVPAVGPGTCQAAANTSGYTANQLASAYGFSTLYGDGLQGTGQTIGIYELEPYTASDITAYKTCYGIATSVTNTNVDGGSTATQSGEAALDIEDAIGLAPGAAVDVFTGPQTGTGPILTY
jgi:subtilase family serine protease